MGNVECDYDIFFCKIHRCVMFILYEIMCRVTFSIKVLNQKHPSPCRIVMCLV